GELTTAHKKGLTFRPKRSPDRGGWMRKNPSLLPAIVLCLAPAASYAVSVPLPTKDVTLNLQVFIQPQLQINENGAPNGTDASYDLFAARTRPPVNGGGGTTGARSS